MQEEPTATKPLVGEVIAIGDELTTGQRLDTNTQWLAARLTEAGIDVRYHTTVADEMAANVAVFRTATDRADVVVSTGGLGPTADDLTRDAMAEAAGVPLLERSDLVEHIEALFTSRGREMPPQNRRQDQLPEGANAIPNPGGTAPGVDQTTSGCRLFALPGVPAEMRQMWDATVRPAIDALPGERRLVRHWLVKCFGLGESHTEQLLPEMIARGREPLVGITASKATITLRVTASGPDEKACHAKMEPTLQEIRETLGTYVFAEQPGGEREIELQEVVIKMLRERGLKLASCELMTRGLLAEWLATADTDGDVYLGGYVRTKDGGPSADRDDAACGCYITVGTAIDGKVPVAVGTQSVTMEKEITLVGHPSIHRPLVAKHALNLLRLKLLETG
ncbi:MAG: molybdopterin-binding protein [Planctomycetota bacterium]